MGSSVEISGECPLLIRLDAIDISDQPISNWEAMYLEVTLSVDEKVLCTTDRIGPVSTFKGPEIGDWRAKWYSLAERLGCALILDDDVTDMQSEIDPEYNL